MSGQRSLLKSVAASKSGRRDNCRADAKHVLVKDDPILIVKIDRDKYHYCLDCARKFIATDGETWTRWRPSSSLKDRSLGAP